MNIHWNWGNKLLIAIVIFMSFIFVLVYLSAQNQIDLVEKDYYPKGLKYQDRIDEIENASNLKDEFRFEKLDDRLALYYPAIQADTGSVYFFRPSDNLLDRTFAFQPDTTGLMYFDIEQFQKGKYIIKVFWEEAGKGYYFERSYNFN